MDNLIEVQGTSIQIKEYKGKRAVTFKDIDTIHQRPIGTASRYFNQNMTQFVEGEDFIIDNDRQIKTGNHGMKVFTVSGYTLLVKPFITDKDNTVMRDMLNKYFVEISGEKDTVNDEVMAESNNLQIFNNPEFGQVRMVEIDSKPYLVANDVAKALGYTIPKDAVARHCKGALKHRYLTGGGEQDLKIIPEGDVYRLIIKSQLPSAERFEKWVFDEVLPTIHKTGSYDMKQESVQQVVTETAQKESIYLEAARIIATQPDSKELVINCLRHIIPDIDLTRYEIQEKTEEDATNKSNTIIEVYRSTDKMALSSPINANRKYSKPFNHSMFHNYLVEHQVKIYWLQVEIGCSSGCISKWRYGQSKPIEHYRIRICKALNLSEGYFDNTKRVRRIKE